MKIIRGIFLFFNIVIILCTLAAILGSFVSPEKVLFPAYFTLVFPFILCLNVCFVIFWLIFRKWYFLFSLLLLIISYPSIKSVFPINIKENTDGPDEKFTIMSYNTWMMGGLKKHTSKSQNNVIRHILESDADIVCLQEFNVADGYLTHDDVVTIFKKYPYKHIYYKNKRRNRRSGIATFSKYPIINEQTINYTSQQNAAIFSDIVINKDTIRLINCHLESNQLTEKDKAMPAELRKNFDAENLSNITLHLSRKLGTAYKTRAGQADYIAGCIKDSPYHVVLCGDFNDVPLSYAYAAIKGSMQDVFVEKGSGPGTTFHENLYKFRIDYIFCDQNFIPLQFKRDKVSYSDHYPISCTLSIKQ